MSVLDVSDVVGCVLDVCVGCVWRCWMAPLPVESPGRVVSRSADVGYRAGQRAGPPCGRSRYLWSSSSAVGPVPAPLLMLIFLWFYTSL